MVAIYSVRMFGIHAGYHRYFSHRALQVGAWLAVCNGISGRDLGAESVLWWAAHHRVHHRHADMIPIFIPVETRILVGACRFGFCLNEYDKYNRR